MYRPSSMTVKNAALSSRVAVSAALTCSGVSMTGTAAAMFSAKPTFVSPRPGSADRLHRQAVAQHGVVPDLIQPGRRELQLGRRPQGASRQ